jgi:hypothetical protein
MMTCLPMQSLVLNIPWNPWIMDDVFLCSPVPNQQSTNECGGPPDWLGCRRGALKLRR